MDGPLQGVAVVVPFRSGCPWRERNAAWVTARYQRSHPWPVIVSDSPGEWSKGAAIDAAVAATDAAVLVLADADSFTTVEAIDHAVRIVADGEAGWAVPHGKVYRLNDDESLRAMAGSTPDKKNVVRPVYPGPAGGGIVVIARTAYETVHGIDPRFTGWGGEDVSFAWALETLVGPHERVGHDLFHLFHPHPAPDLQATPEVVALKAQYREARLVPRLMRGLVERRDPDPDTPLAEPRTFWSARADRVIRIGPKVARFKRHLLTTTDPDLVESLPLFANVEEVPE